MAVRRISDLPNLYSYYEDADLSSGLMEVSYADPSQPRRYVSFHANVGEVFDRELAILSNYATKTDLSKYVLKTMVQHLSSSIDDNSTWIPDGNAIYDYIEAQDFLTPADLGPYDGIGDAINAIQALLNTKNLHLWVAQNGVKVDEVVSNSYVRYDIVDVASGGITLIWKDDPSNYSGMSDFNTKHYNAKKDDLILFKSINDAMTIAQRFKFLQGSQIFIHVCTDLIVPLHIAYTYDNNNKVTLTSVSVIEHAALSHSDDCTVNIQGRKINSVKITYNTEGKITRYQIDTETCTRVIYRDTNSLYNSRYKTLMSSNQTTNWSYLLFDAGNSETYNYDITFNNYCFAQYKTAKWSTFSKVAFIMYNYPIRGENMNIENCSFSQCQNCIDASNGSTQIRGGLEMVQCKSLITSGNASVYRDATNAGGMYVQGHSVDTFHFGSVTSNGIASLQNFNTYAPDYGKQFMRLNSSGEWVYASYQDVSELVMADDSSLTDYIVNPRYNQMIPYIGSDVISCDKTLSLSSNTISFLNKINSDTYDSKYLNDSSQTKCGYNGYVNRGYITMSLDVVQQTVISKSAPKFYNNYANDRLNSGSYLRKAYETAGFTNFNYIWNMPYYQSNYNHSHQYAGNLADQQLSVYHNNSFNHNMFSNSWPITTQSYSVAQWRDTVDPNTWTNIMKSTMDSFIETAKWKYDYTYQATKVD